MTMSPAWRGVVVWGKVWAWPTLLMTHATAFRTLGLLEDEMTCRWRQWTPGGPIDFDPGASEEDKALVTAWVEVAS